MEYGIMSIPTIVIIKNGKAEKTLVGLRDKEEIKRLGLDKLRFGDLVLLQDHDNTYGTGYLGGAISIGVIIHSDCVKSGHGPGVTVIMSSSKGNIEGVIDSNANIGYYMNK